MILCDSRLNTLLVMYFQKAATDALQSMTTVLKDESLAGKSYEALFDGARSLATGLGNMLKVSSYGAREFEISDTHQLDSPNLNRRRRSLGFLHLEAHQRSKRDTAKEQLQAKNEVQ